MTSGPFDLEFTLDNMEIIEKIGYVLGGFKLSGSDKDFETNSGINHFKSEGIILRGKKEPTSNNNRVYLAANRDDSIVDVRNTLRAIEKLNLADTNYRIYKSGGHGFEGNEWLLAVSIYKFIKKYL
ncbi:MAG: hypothetical protein GF364_05890 [Candidatus Lokiarchaeota archaeon]|nr:hypothetical protein [Candidatus Lokiarchaeota archaeon]